jgi:serine protease Do
MKIKWTFFWFAAFFVVALAYGTNELRAQKAPIIKSGDPMPINLFVELGKLINPAVVNISTAQKVIRRPMGPQRPNDPFWEFFEQFMGPQGIQQRPAQALGTGFIIEDDGLIVTNAHVISEADEIKVQIVGDKKLYDAVVVGRDTRSDIGLIRVKVGHKLPIVALGNSESVEVGEWVAAFGNPFGHTNSMSKGIISAKGRALEELNAFPFLQTDASINPGNSGGPLVNTRGEVIGVNTAIDARAQGVGFAIPIDAVKSLIPELKNKGRISRGFFGVGLADIDSRAAVQLGLKSDEGALVVNVQAGSPAEKAGIQVYDFITDFNGREVKSARDLMNAVLDAPMGKPVDGQAIRNGQKTKFKVTLKEKEDEAPPVSQKVVQGGGQTAPHGLGFKVAKLNQQLALQLHTAYIREEPPVVTHVDPKGPASKAGLHPGDLVLDVNKKPVKSPQDVIKNLQAGTNTLRVSRGGNMTMVFID